MKILQKYSTSSRYSSFTDTDRCFFFKPAFDDLSETQFKWTMSRDEFNALYHYELQSRGHQATIRVEYEQTQRQENPHFHQSVNDMQESYGDIAKSNGTYEDFALYNGSSYYREDLAESDFESQSMCFFKKGGRWYSQSKTTKKVKCVYRKDS